MNKELKLKKMNAIVKTLAPSGKKMGDLFTLQVGKDKVTYDTREYYSGRGSKYNSTIKHGDIRVKMSVELLNMLSKPALEAKKQQERYLKHCADPKFIKKLVKEKIITGESLNNLREGVYRVGMKSGKVVAALSGGYHNSQPSGVDDNQWAIAVDEVIYKVADCIIKADYRKGTFVPRDKNYEFNNRLTKLKALVS